MKIYFVRMQITTPDTSQAIDFKEYNESFWLIKNAGFIERTNFTLVHYTNIVTTDNP